MQRGEAMRRREAGVRALASGPNRGLHARILRAILRRAPGVAFTSEDLRRSIRGAGHANAWGAAIHNAARAGYIVRDGFRLAERPESHARVLAIWRRA